jgi:hypothetical protein
MFSTASGLDTTAAAAPRPVILGERGDSVIVLGKCKPRLTCAQYDVIRALLVAGDNGLTKDELDAMSDHTAARKILRRLRASDSDWAAVIQMAGRPWRRYRIFCEAATNAH